MSLTKFSDAAWEIASRYSDLLASETRDLAGAIDAALARAAIAAMPSWRPIETAPKDGRLIDLWRPSAGRLTEAYWHEGMGWSSRYGRISGATHWQPLPPPPKSEGGQT